MGLRPTITSPSPTPPTSSIATSYFRDLIGFAGDGLLTTDDSFHRTSRRIMLPAFHHARILASLDTMLDETSSALDSLAPGARFDLYAWTRRLALRIAMRALFGLDPDGPAARSIDAAALFEQTLSFYSRDYTLRMLRGPFTPWVASSGPSHAHAPDLLGDLSPALHGRPRR